VLTLACRRAAAQVGILDAGVRGDRRGRSLRQQRAVGEHADLLRDALHHAHPVLDKQHRQPLAETPDQLGHPLGLADADARGGLVEAQHDGVARERHRHLDRAPVGVRERPAGQMLAGG
jgi:hypothetical protein